MNLNRLPPHLRDPKMVYFMALMVLCLCAIISTAIISPYPGIRLQCAVVAALWLVLMVRFFRGVSGEDTLRVGSVLAVLHITGEALQSNQVYASSLVWFSLLPVTHFHLTSPKAGNRWALVVVFMTVLTALFGLWRGEAANLAFGVDQAPMFFSEYLLAALGVMLVPWIYSKRYEETLAVSQRRQDELLAKQAELERTQRMQEQFIASVSHELRTPMNAILGLNSVLLERVLDKPGAQKVLDYTRQSADHLMTVINDVLDYSQIHQGQIKSRIERVALHDTVRTAFELFLPQVEGAPLRYTLDIAPGVPEWVETDRHRLMQILVNLLGNAIKFTHQGQVLLKVALQDGGVAFAVEDTGIGIAPEQQATIFEGFGQADATIQGRFGGTGLGLTISQRLVHLLGGELQLDSQPGAGTRFRFCLPFKVVSTPDVPAPEAPARAGPTQKTRRFLIVDDHPVNRMLVRHVLLRQWPQASVVEAENGSEALAAMTQGPAFDLVFMDMVMPVMDGIEATRLIKTNKRADIRQTPVMGLTANVSHTDLDRFKAAGLDGLLLKPFDVAHLRAEAIHLMHEA